MSGPIRGRCHCGAVQVALTPPTDFVGHCHCASCRLTHAAAFVTWTSVPRERFELVCGEQALTWYASSPTIRWGFCSVCGASLLYSAIAEGHADSPRVDVVYVAAGCLTDPLDREPSVHVSYEERVPWLRCDDELPKHRAKSDERLDPWDEV